MAISTPPPPMMASSPPRPSILLSALLPVIESLVCDPMIFAKPLIVSPVASPPDAVATVVVSLPRANVTPTAFPLPSLEASKLIVLLVAVAAAVTVSPAFAMTTEFGVVTVVVFLPATEFAIKAGLVVEPVIVADAVRVSKISVLTILLLAIDPVDRHSISNRPSPKERIRSSCAPACKIWV